MDWKKLFKIMLGTGLFLIETNRASHGVRKRVNNLRDAARDKYDDLMDRFDDISDSIGGRRDYVTPIGSFLIGMGVGAGLGLLFAPASGEETRSALWDHASDLRDRVANRASDVRDRASEFADQARETVRRETGDPSSQPYSRPA
jgi:gas vesicle protein